ncbi:MAG: hypothetical protein ACRCVE_09375 [Plesiomonas sp.]
MLRYGYVGVVIGHVAFVTEVREKIVPLSGSIAKWFLYLSSLPYIIVLESVLLVQMY